jgi:hypothetical protein
MHEIAHFLCGHQPSGMVSVGNLVLRRYDAVQEEEAAWLGGCLQIPRSGLIWALGRGMGNPQIALHFGSSEDLVRWRRAQSGVDVQLKRRTRLVT